MRGEKDLKRWLKRKMFFIFSLLVTFLITDVVGYASGKTWDSMSDEEKLKYLYDKVRGDNVTIDSKESNYDTTNGNYGTNVSIGDNNKPLAWIKANEERVPGNHRIMLGYNNESVHNSFTLGDSNKTLGSQSLAIGYQSNGMGHDSIAMGMGANALVSKVIKDLGDGSRDFQARNIAIGENAITSAYSSAYGPSAAALSNYSLAIGTQAIVGGDNADSFTGDIYSLNITAKTSITDEKVKEEYKDYLKNINFDKLDSSDKEIILRNLRVSMYIDKTPAIGATAIGFFSRAKTNYGVALGSQSIADRSAFSKEGKEAPFSKFKLNNDNTLGAISIGNSNKLRQITNLADATEDTDAVNLRQLKAAFTEVNNSKVKYFSVKQTTDVNNNLNDGASAEGSIAIGPNASAKYEGKAKGGHGIAIGDEASSHIMGDGSLPNALEMFIKETKPNGIQENSILLGRTAEEQGAGIAIGWKAHARKDSIDIGNRNYSGKIGDSENITAWNESAGVGTTTVGSTSYNAPYFGTINGAFNIISKYITPGSNTNPSVLLDRAEKSVQGLGGVILGTFNSIEAKDKDRSSNGLTNILVGTGNITSKSNASLVIGVGNTIKNSYIHIPANSLFAGGNLFNPLQKLPSSIKEAQEKFITLSKSSRGGSVSVIGGGNEVESALLSNVSGVGNILKGDFDATNILNQSDLNGIEAINKYSTFNNINGYENKAKSITHTMISGSKNIIENADRTVLMGNNFTLKGTTEAKTDKNILIGFNDENKEDRIKESAKNVTSLGNNNEIKADNVSILGSDVSANVENSVYLGNSSTMIKNKGKNLTNDKVEGATTTAGATGTVDKAEIKDGDNVIATYSGFAGEKSVGGITVGASGAERRIMNVAAGEISETSTDAINGSQLYAIAKNIKNIASEEASSAVTNLDKGNVTSNTITITNGTGRVLGTDDLNLEIKEGSITSAHLSTNLNNTINNKADKTYVEGNFVKLDGSNIDDTNKATLKEKLDIGNGEVKEGNNKTVTGDTVYKALKNFNEVNNVTNNSINILNDKVDKLDDKFKGAIAATAAIAGIPQVASDKLFGIGAGVSSYGGKQAIAFGISGQNLGRNIVYKISGAVDTNKNFVASAGINYSFGSTEPVAKVKEFKDLQDTIDSLKKEIAQIKTEKAVDLNKELLFVIDNFRLDGSEISESNKVKIKEVVDNLNKNYKDRIIDIIGYTDTHAGDKYNLSLGLRRANAVANFMKEYGLDESFVIRRIESKGYNQIKNGTYGDLRRVEIIIK